MSQSLCSGSVSVFRHALHEQLFHGHLSVSSYDIMSACWQKNPTDRPHFAIIHENLDELVTSKIVSQNETTIHALHNQLVPILT
jgi:hypothetical protein